MKLAASNIARLSPANGKGIEFLRTRGSFVPADLPSGGHIVTSEDKVRENFLWDLWDHPITPETVFSARGEVEHAVKSSLADLPQSTGCDSEPLIGSVDTLIMKKLELNSIQTFRVVVEFYPRSLYLIFRKIGIVYERQRN